MPEVVGKMPPPEPDAETPGEDESVYQERSQTICVCPDCVMKYLADFEKNKDTIVMQSSQLSEEKDEPADIDKNLHAK